MKIIPYGDGALLVNFQQVIDPDVNKRVIDLCRSIEQSDLIGISFVTPAYCSLTVGFDPLKISFNGLKKQIERLEIRTSRDENSTRLTIPVCYSNEFALDKEDVEQKAQMNWEQIIELHTSVKYRVFMLGFLPGFVYLGSVPPELSLARKESPRLKVPALSVGIAGFQTGIYPTEAPGGWQILGKTPIRIFDNRLDKPFLCEPGMTVSFRAIDDKEFEKISDEIENQAFSLDSLYE